MAKDNGASPPPRNRSLFTPGNMASSKKLSGIDDQRIADLFSQKSTQLEERNQTQVNAPYMELTNHAFTNVIGIVNVQQPTGQIRDEPHILSELVDNVIGRDFQMPYKQEQKNEEVHFISLTFQKGENGDLIAQPFKYDKNDDRVILSHNELKDKGLDAFFKDNNTLIIQKDDLIIHAEKDYEGAYNLQHFLDAQKPLFAMSINQFETFLKQNGMGPEQDQQFEQKVTYTPETAPEIPTSKL